MNKVDFTIIENKHLTRDVCLMLLSGDTSAIRAPGQFINLSLTGFTLRRPISICDYDENQITLIYKTVGKGTAAMEKMKVGETIDALVGLGNGFDTAKSGETPLLIGGGVGIPPLYNLCKKLIAEKKIPTVVMGFNTKDEVFFEREFASLGCNVFITTVDGSYGSQGFVTDIMPKIDYSYFYTCGPMPMFRAIEKVVLTSGQYSFEERMGCGFGVCMGCSMKTKSGSKRVCTDGPVFDREEIIW